MESGIDKKNKGFTLIETLMAIAIFSVGIGGFSLLFVNSWKNNRFTIELGQSSSAVSIGMNRMVGYLRGIRQSDNGAYLIDSADDNNLVVYGDYDNDSVTERLHFYYTDKQILMGIRRPTGTVTKTYAAGDGEIMLIAKNVVNDASTPVFYYYNENYPGDTANNPVPTPANVANIRLMKIYLKVNIDPYHAPDNVEMQTFIRFRNLSSDN